MAWLGPLSLNFDKVNKSDIDMAGSSLTKSSIDQSLSESSKIQNLTSRLEFLEKKVLGEYQAQKIQNKTNGTLEFENDVAGFFQHQLSFKEWQKIFNDLKIVIDKSDLLTLSENYSVPKKL